jgi:hypothetical protein
MTRRVVPLLVATLAALLLTLGLAGPASASVNIDQKVALLSSWTQASGPSQAAWNNGRTHQADWAAYNLVWSTDYCSASPDQPLGFDFRMPCWRHDFGYRNYKVVSRFPANKAHIDDAFYWDLKAVCRTYGAIQRPACYSLAWTYYQAVHNFGDVVVTAAELDHAAQILAQSEAQAATTTSAR